MEQNGRLMPSVVVFEILYLGRLM